MDKKINKKEAMKGIYKKLESLGHEAAGELRRFDAATKTLLADAMEGINRGEVNRDWVSKLNRERESQRVALTKSFDEKFYELQNEAAKTIDEAMMPTPDELDAGDLEILREFTMTASEFERMARKYEDASNFSMLRKLDAYRKEHNINTPWRLHDGAKRKEDFALTVFGVRYSYDPKYHDDPEGSVTKNVGNGYRAMQGADQEAFPTPETEQKQSVAEKMAAAGTMIF